MTAPYDRWRRSVDADQPISIQTNIAHLAQRLNVAEHLLTQLERLHRADEYGRMCVGCRNQWPCATFQILDGAP